MKTYESAEDYLERILMLEGEYGRDNVHAIEVANALGFSRASVSIAMHRLEESGHIRFGEAKQLILTDSGRAIAKDIYGRHQILQAFFVSLGVPKEKAEEDACKVEHDLSKESFDAIKAYMETK
ncbi:MAG: metal-dependent transcriptional regulator [Bacilli bacterium]|nr:metal-dependent transcriptional regulator [Bacilli bacterium]